MTGEYDFAKGGKKSPFIIGGKGGSSKPGSGPIEKPKPNTILTEIFKKKHKVHPQGK